MKIIIESKKFNSYNSIGAKGAAKLGEGVSKLLNLTSLDLNFE
jgi:hypothetical protein